MGSEASLPYVHGQGFRCGHVVLKLWGLLWHDAQLRLYEFEPPLGVCEPEIPDFDRQGGTCGYLEDLDVLPLHLGQSVRIKVSISSIRVKTRGFWDSLGFERTLAAGRFAALTGNSVRTVASLFSGPAL